MIYSSDSIVLLISKDRKVRNLFRKIVTQTGQCHLVINNSIDDCSKYPSTKIIFLDISRIEKSFLTSFLKKLKSIFIAVPIFIITDKKTSKPHDTQCCINFILSNTSFLIIDKPIKEITIKSILSRYTSCFRENTVDLVKYNGLILNQEKHFALYNNCKIFLTKQESTLLSILIYLTKNNLKSDIKSLKRSLLNRENSDVTEDSIRICIYRIRKKFKEQIDLDIIGNRYGEGYDIKI